MRHFMSLLTGMLLSIDSIVPLPEWNVMMDNGRKEVFDE
ncbi:hypothetical protein B4110_2540 [Parageobacillus toebii]|uniref:Uncharacterized protein n=1 Tax=Parageobacillus toebii TaxID=153151 RepID=A0A150MMV6_9BACL|nr:hypothetical protein B4110_2540 [Parageobacillus toebii]